MATPIHDVKVVLVEGENDHSCNNRAAVLVVIGDAGNSVDTTATDDEPYATVRLGLDEGASGGNILGQKKPRKPQGRLLYVRAAYERFTRSAETEVRSDYRCAGRTTARRSLDKIKS